MKQLDISKRFTKGQLKLEKILNGIGFSTVLEYEVGNYSIDIFVPELNTGFEYDGAFHFRKRDELRDKNLMHLYNIKVVRIKGEGLNERTVRQKVAETFNLSD